jgi:transcriptional regulator with XRE-family HTH domain
MASLKALFGERVREIRKARKMTQTELAGRLDLDYRYVGAVERGEVNLTIETIEKIAFGFNVEPYQLFLFFMGGELQQNTIVEDEKMQEIITNAHPEIKKALAQILPVLIQLNK